MAKTRTKIVPVPVPVRAPMRAPMARTPMVPPQASPVPGVPPVGMGGPGGVGMKHGGKSHMKKMAKGGPTEDPAIEAGERPLKHGEHAVQKSGHTRGMNLKHGGKVHKHAEGGKIKMFKEKETMGPKSMSEDVEKGSNKLTKHGESAVQKRGHTKGYNLGDSGKTVKPKDIKPMRKGGYAKVADGIAKRGHTKGKYC